MSVPPLEFVNYYQDDSLSEKITIYFLTEGIVSEKYFYRKLFSSSFMSLVDKEKYLIREMEKTLSDKGLSHPVPLIKKSH